MKKKRKQRSTSMMITMSGRTGGRRYQTVEKAFQPEHPFVYGTTIDAVYQLNAATLRTIVGLGDEWLLSSVLDAGFASGKPGLKGATVTFTRNVSGPARAMEILAGDKPEPEKGESF